LLPALQTWEKSEKYTKVLILFDLSGSMTISDDMPSPSVPLDKMPTRHDKLAKFLTDEQANFLKRLQEKNPVVVYGFGGRLDEEARTFPKDGANWTPAQWSAWLRMDLLDWVLEDLSEAGKEFARKSKIFELPKQGTSADWATDWLKLER